MRFSEEQEKKLVAVLDRKNAPMERQVGEWQAAWDDIARFVRPDGDRYARAKVPDIFDSTAPEALEGFASGTHAQLNSPTERWFALTLTGLSPTEVPVETALWMEQAADLLYYSLSVPSACFNSAMSEAYNDLGAFGTCCVFQEEVPNGFRFRSIPLHSIRIRENSKDEVDTVFRRYTCDVRQIGQEWPDASQHPRIVKRKDNEQLEVVHSVFPLSDADAEGFLPPAKSRLSGFKFVSVYWIPSEKVILSVSGFRTMPYHVGRWSKLAGQTYGRSPAMKALADIKMVNAMSREMILAAEQANRPPMLVDDESLLIPMRAVVPGSITYVHPGSRDPRPLVSGFQPQMAENEMENRRESIKAAFFTDLFIRGKKKERQSVLEIQDDRAELTKQLLPMFGRLQSEMLTPIIVRSLDILVRQGRCTPPPEGENTGIGPWTPMAVAYTNSATKLQLNGRAVAIGQLFADLAPMAQNDPTVLEVIDWTEAAAELARARDVPLKLIRSKKDVEAMRERRQQAQEQQQTAINSAQMGRTIRDVATARSIDPSLLR